MSDIIDEVNNDVDWIRVNAHEHGDEMVPEPFNIEDEDDFDDDTALDMEELNRALEGTALGDVHVDIEGNIGAPTDPGNSGEPCSDSNPDLLESNKPVEVIDVDTINLDSDSDSVSDNFD